MTSKYSGLKKITSIQKHIKISKAMKTVLISLEKSLFCSRSSGIFYFIPFLSFFTSFFLSVHCNAVLKMCLSEITFLAHNILKNNLNQNWATNFGLIFINSKEVHVTVLILWDLNSRNTDRSVGLRLKTGIDYSILNSSKSQQTCICMCSRW